MGQEFILNLEDNKKLISTLEEITKIHTSFSDGILYSGPFIRGQYFQYPVEVNEIKLYVRSREEINIEKLKNIIKENFGACVIYYKNSMDNKLIESYFLPKAVNKNPLIRILD